MSVQQLPLESRQRPVRSSTSVVCCSGGQKCQQQHRPTNHWGPKKWRVPYGVVVVLALMASVGRGRGVVQASFLLTPPRISRISVARPSSQRLFNLDCSGTNDENNVCAPQDCSLDPNNQNNRRHLLIASIAASSSIAASWAMPFAREATALAATTTTTPVFTRNDVANQFAYVFTPPSNFAGPTKKPLQTHLDEVNFSSETIAAYQFGITVDPVRIASLMDFGTPEQVAAKVVTAEVNRDGVYNVKLVEDPISAKSSSTTAQSDGDDGMIYYQLNYISSGKRGDKRFIAKFYIQNQKLYALTAQCKEQDYSQVQASMLEAVNSFRVQ